MDLDLYAPAADQIAWLAAGTVTSEQLLDAYVARHEALHPMLNAVVSTDVDAARSAARNIDRRRSSGEPVGPLQGLPMTVKDTFDVDGLPAVSGHAPFTRRQPQVADAALVSRLKTAGAVIWGKTNTPKFAGDIQTYNKVYGVTNNPYDLDRTPGGSSGGAAAAVAAAITPWELGSDIGGSLRIPASHCGLVTLKPTWGQLPLKGHVPPAPGAGLPDPDLAVAGPMARNVDDVQLLFSVLNDTRIPTPTWHSLEGLRVGVWREPAFPVSHDVETATLQLSELLRLQGARLSPEQPAVSGPELCDLYFSLLSPIVFADVPSAVRVMIKPFRPLLKTMLTSGQTTLATALCGMSQSRAVHAAALQRRAALKLECERYFDKHDLLIAPVTSLPAISHDTGGSPLGRSISVDGRANRYTSLMDWITLATTCHLPSIVIPVRLSASGLPIGVQLIGREGSDWQILEIARLIEAAHGWTARPTALSHHD